MNQHRSSEQAVTQQRRDAPSHREMVPARRKFLGGMGATALAGSAGLLGLASQAQSGPPPVTFVLNSADANLSLIDQRSFTESTRLDVGKEPHHLFPTPDDRSLIVANAGSNTLSFFDPATAELQGVMRGIDDPYQLGFSPDQRWFGVAALRLDRIDLYRHEGNSLALAARLPAPRAPSHLVWSQDSRWMFVTLQDSDEICAIDTQTMQIAWRMGCGRQPAGIWISPDGGTLFVGVMGENYVNAIDWRARRSVRRIMTGDGAHNFRPYGDRRHLFVSNRVANTVTIVDMLSMSLAGDIPVPSGPDCMEMAADGRTLWVTQRWSRSVAIIDLAERRVVRSINVGRSPHGLYMRNRAPWV